MLKTSPTLGSHEAVPPSGPRVGTVLSGRWELIALLGAGGMGEVWRAQHVSLGRQVAVKLLTVPSAANRARLAREARILAGLRHSSIVEVFDVGEHDATPYFVMEWVDGESLAQRVGRAGPLAPGRAVPLFLPVLDGLAAAHRAGIVHRDVKPDNVLVAPAAAGGERLVLIDFGIARGAPGGAVDGRLTRTGALVGTPEYMAPEVLRGRDADVRSDVWSMCVTLFEVIAGISPFRRSDFVATVRAVVDDAPTSWPASLDGELRTVLARGLAKDEGERHQSLVQLRDDLAAWADGARAGRTEAPADLCDTSPAWRRPELPSALTATSRSGGRAATEPPGDEPAAAPPGFSLDALIRSRFGQEG